MGGSSVRGGSSLVAKAEFQYRGAARSCLGGVVGRSSVRGAGGCGEGRAGARGCRVRPGSSGEEAWE